MNSQEKRLREVLDRDDVIHVLRMTNPVSWPFKHMEVGDEVSFYPIHHLACRAAHSHGGHAGKKFETRTEWPLTVITRIS